MLWKIESHKLKQVVFVKVALNKGACTNSKNMKYVWLVLKIGRTGDENVEESAMVLIVGEWIKCTKPNYKSRKIGGSIMIQL